MAKEASIYITIAGDTWDSIAYKVYGNEEFCDKIMDANRDKLDMFVFSAGVELTIPHRDTFTGSNVNTDFPDWRSVLNG
jgi:phage tail protein X